MCVDEKDMPIARFETKHFSLKEKGRFEIVAPPPGVALDRVVDEVVVTGFAVVELKRRQKNRSSCGGRDATVGG